MTPARDGPASKLRFEPETEPQTERLKGPSWKRAAARLQREKEQAEGAAQPGPSSNISPAPEFADEQSDETAQVASGQNVPKSTFRRESRRRSASVSQPSGKGKFHNESQQARPADRLHQESGGDGPGPEGPEPLYREKHRVEKRGQKLEQARGKLAKQKPAKPPGPVRHVVGAAGYAAHGYVHGKIYEVERENVGTEAAHRSELVGEAVGQKTVRFVKRRVRTRPARSVQRAERRYDRAATSYNTKRAAVEHPELRQAKAWQKQQRRKRTQGAAQSVTATAERLTARAVESIKRHPAAVITLLVCLLLVMLLQSCTASLAAVSNGLTGSLSATTYPTSDSDLLGAEAVYAGLEAELQSLLDRYEDTHNYDECRFELDEIEHDPYVLLSILSALQPEGWRLSDMGSTLQVIFDRQYTLTETVTEETRQNEDGEAETYTVCTVKLENFDLSHLPVYIMGEEALARYSVYMRSLGNRPGLFPTSPYVLRYGSGPVTRYEIPPEALTDERFAAMIEEAEKYLGYPYVWGGSSPATSFDCSGFVSWVINHSGWDVGRLATDGLYFNVCTPVSPSEAKPGDLIFFQGTYKGAGVTSHVGIYVGNGMMLHCGDPIQYTSINSSYWQTHFYGFGRLP